MPLHSSYTTTNLHVPGYKQSSDPGAVGAGIEWVDTSTSPYTHKSRNTANTGWDTIGGNGSGSVTSVAQSVPAELSVSGTPVTTTGTIALTWASGTGAGGQGKVIATPSGGGAGAYAGRVLAAGDIPALPASQITSGTLAVARGGTNAATAGANTGFMGPTSGGAAAPAFRALVNADLPMRDITNISTNTTLTAAHDIVTVDTSGGNVTVTLPSAATRRALPLTIIIKDASSHVNVAPAGGDTIGFNLTGSFNLDTIGGVGTQLQILPDGGTNWVVLQCAAITQP